MIDKWKHRRNMSYASLIAGLLFPLLMIISENEQLGQVAIPFYLFVSTVVSAYVGAATYGDIQIEKLKGP